MPRKTIAGLEAIISAKDAEIVELHAKLAGYGDQAEAQAEEIGDMAERVQSKASAKREVAISHAVSRHVGRRKLRRIRDNLNPDVLASLPACWNFLRQA